MKNKNTENEYLGIAAIIIIVCLAIVGLYYFFSYRSSVVNDPANLHVPLEAPSVVKDVNNNNNPE